MRDLRPEDADDDETRFRHFISRKRARKEKQLDSEDSVTEISQVQQGTKADGEPESDTDRQDTDFAVEKDTRAVVQRSVRTHEASRAKFEKYKAAVTINLRANIRYLEYKLNYARRGSRRWCGGQHITSAPLREGVEQLLRQEPNSELPMLIEAKVLLLTNELAAISKREFVVVTASRHTKAEKRVHALARFAKTREQHMIEPTPGSRPEWPVKVTKANMNDVINVSLARIRHMKKVPNRAIQRTIDILTRQRKRAGDDAAAMATKIMTVAQSAIQEINNRLRLLREAVGERHSNVADMETAQAEEARLRNKFARQNKVGRNMSEVEKVADLFTTTTNALDVAFLTHDGTPDVMKSLLGLAPMTTEAAVHAVITAPIIEELIKYTLEKSSGLSGTTVGLAFGAFEAAQHASFGGRPSINAPLMHAYLGSCNGLLKRIALHAAHNAVVLAIKVATNKMQPAMLPLAWSAIKWVLGSLNRLHVILAVCVATACASAFYAHFKWHADVQPAKTNLFCTTDPANIRRAQPLIDRFAIETDTRGMCAATTAIAITKAGTVVAPVNRRDLSSTRNFVTQQREEGNTLIVVRVHSIGAAEEEDEQRSVAMARLSAQHYHVRAFASIAVFRPRNVFFGFLNRCEIVGLEYGHANIESLLQAWRWSDSDDVKRVRETAFVIEGLNVVANTNGASHEAQINALMRFTMMASDAALTARLAPNGQSACTSFDQLTKMIHENLLPCETQHSFSTEESTSQCVQALFASPSAVCQASRDRTIAHLTEATPARHAKARAFAIISIATIAGCLAWRADTFFSASLQFVTGSFRRTCARLKAMTPRIFSTSPACVTSSKTAVSRLRPNALATTCSLSPALATLALQSLTSETSTLSIPSMKDTSFRNTTLLLLTLSSLVVLSTHLPTQSKHSLNASDAQSMSLSSQIVATATSLRNSVTGLLDSSESWIISATTSTLKAFQSDSEIVPSCKSLTAFLNSECTKETTKPWKAITQARERATNTKSSTKSSEVCSVDANAKPLPATQAVPKVVGSEPTSASMQRAAFDQVTRGRRSSTTHSTSSKHSSQRRTTTTSPSASFSDESVTSAGAHGSKATTRSSSSTSKRQQGSKPTSSGSGAKQSSNKQTHAHRVSAVLESLQTEQISAATKSSSSPETSCHQPSVTPVTVPAALSSSHVPSHSTLPTRAHHVSRTSATPSCGATATSHQTTQCTTSLSGSNCFRRAASFSARTSQLSMRSDVLDRSFHRSLKLRQVLESLTAISSDTTSPTNSHSKTPSAAGDTKKTSSSPATKTSTSTNESACATTQHNASCQVTSQTSKTSRDASSLARKPQNHLGSTSRAQAATSASARTSTPTNVTDVRQRPSSLNELD